MNGNLRKSRPQSRGENGVGSRRTEGILNCIQEFCRARGPLPIGWWTINIVSTTWKAQYLPVFTLPARLRLFFGQLISGASDLYLEGIGFTVGGRAAAVANGGVTGFGGNWAAHGCGL